MKPLKIFTKIKSIFFVPCALCPRARFAREQRGRMMIELLLALALAAAMLPFLLRQEKARIQRAENIRASRDIALVRSALEKYMDANKQDLMSTISRNVVRVSISDLEDYGLDPSIIGKESGFQVRVVKSADRGGRSFLQGIVVMDSENVSPVRTREIAQLGGEAAGFAEGGRTYGAFGTWGVNANIWNANFSDTSIVDVTGTLRSGNEYIMRVPSKDSADAAMQSDLSLGGHSVIDARSITAEAAHLAEFVNAANASVTRLVIENRPTLDGKMSVSGETLVAGALSADSRSLETERMTISGTSRLNAVNARELWAGDLSLSGLSVESERDRPARLSVNRAIDMIGGRVVALVVAVGFTGSVTPRLVVRDRIEDAADSTYFWDLESGDAVFSDLEIPVLNQMMQAAVKREADGVIAGVNTEASRIMTVVANNANATVADFLRALRDIESRVTSKYNMLNLE